MDAFAVFRLIPDEGISPLDWQFEHVGNYVVGEDEYSTDAIERAARAGLVFAGDTVRAISLMDESGWRRMKATAEYMDGPPVTTDDIDAFTRRRAEVERARQEALAQGSPVANGPAAVSGGLPTPGVSAGAPASRLDIVAFDDPGQDEPMPPMPPPPVGA